MNMQIKTKLALINSLIAGGLVFLGAFASGYITLTGVIAAGSASGIVFLTKMQDFFKTASRIKRKKGVKRLLFDFI